MKVLVSGWLVYHLAGLIIAPSSVPPSSALIQNSWRYFGPYLQLVNMNQGNHFFAPDPGASTLVRYVAELPDGRVVEGQIPDKSTFPRLLYHRHFMLTESLGGMDDVDVRVRPLLVRALARQICQEQGAEAVTLKQTVHLLALIDWVRAGESLNDPELFEERTLGRFLATDFREP